MNINIPDLPGNSNMEKAQKVREARAEVTSTDISAPAQKGLVKGRIRKRGIVKLSDVFVMQDVASVLVDTGKNVFIPRLRQLMYEIVDNVARGVFLGEAAEFSPRMGRHTDYQSITKSRVSSSGTKTFTRGESSTISTSQQGSGFRFDNVEFDDYGKAKIVLDALDEIIENAGVVTVADLYSVAQISFPFTANYYGWTDISTAKIKTDGQVYWIKFPRVKQLDN